MKIGDKSYSFDKILRNEEIEYFTLPYLRSQLNYKEGLEKYMIEYLTSIIKGIRISNNGKRTQSLFEPDKEYSSIVGGGSQWVRKNQKSMMAPRGSITVKNKEETKVSEIIKNATFVFIDWELNNIIDGLSKHFGDDYELIHKNFELLKNKQNSSEAIFEWFNEEGVSDLEIKIISFNSSFSLGNDPKNSQNIISSIKDTLSELKVLNSKQNSAVNVFYNVNKEIKFDNEHSKEHWKILDLLI